VLGWLASGAYLGCVPVAPGTVGALWGIPLTLAIIQLPSIWLEVVLIVVLATSGVALTGAVAAQLGHKDPSCIVWDEIVSVPITFFLIPHERLYSPVVLIVGFLLNRVFDVSKPPPARWLERLPGGLGIMADDWCAGVYSCALLHAWLRWGGLG
jgi:phosphatidylglycerophosphatase A